MKCRNCGKDIRSEDTFCPFCGTKNKTQNTEPIPIIQAQGENKKPSTGRFIAGLLGILILGLAVFLGYREYDYRSKVTKADRLFASSEYEAAIPLYEEAVQKRGNVKDIEKLQEANIYLKGQKNYSKGMDHMNAGQYALGLQSLALVSSDLTEIKDQIEEELLGLKSPVYSKVEKLILNGNYTEADEIVTAYLALAPEDKDFQGLEKKSLTLQNSLLLVLVKLPRPLQLKKSLIRARQLEPSQNPYKMLPLPSPI